MLKKQSIKNKKILITGGAGFIGSFLVKKLLDTNSITILDNFRRNALQYTNTLHHPNLKLITGDVLNDTDLQLAIRGQDYIIHLAAIAGVSSYYENPLRTLEVDALGTYKVLSLASEYRVKQVILFSTSEVYGPHANNVSEEDMTIIGPATDSRWSYAAGKLIGDHFAYAFAKVKKLPITIIRPFNVFGPLQIGEGAIQIFAIQAIKNEPLTIRGTGEQIRSWCYIDDFIKVSISMLGNIHAYNQIFNIGNPANTVSNRALADLIKKIAHSQSEVIYVQSNMTDVLERKPNITKAQKLLGFDPHITLAEGLTETIKWYKKLPRSTV